MTPLNHTGLAAAVPAAVAIGLAAWLEADLWLSRQTVPVRPFASGPAADHHQARGLPVIAAEASGEARADSPRAPASAAAPAGDAASACRDARLGCSLVRSRWERLMNGGQAGLSLCTKTVADAKGRQVRLADDSCFRLRVAELGRMRKALDAELASCGRRSRRLCGS